MGLFDSPWHILIVLLVLVVLFGSAKLPRAAKSMGEAMRIFKKEAQKLHEDDDKGNVQAAVQQQLPAPAPQQPIVASQPVVAQPAAQQPVMAQPPVAQPAAPPPVAQPAPNGTASTPAPEAPQANQPG